MNQYKKKSKKEKHQHNKNKEEIPVVSKKLVRMLGLFIGIIGFVIYANTFQHGFVLDDYSVIKDNYIVKQGVDGIPTILKTNYRYGYWNSQGVMYRPLSLMMFATEWDLFGYNENTGTPDGKAPVGMHIINVLIYALSGMILFFTLRKILQKYSLIIPFVCTLLFIMHPLHTEVVANIKSRDELLSFFFVILSVQWLWKYFDKEKILYLLVSVIFFFVAFMSKEGTITFLAVTPLMVVFFTEKEGMWKRVAVSMIFIVPTAAYMLLRMKVLGDINVGEAISVNDNLLMAAKSDASPFDRQIPTAILILGYYLILLVFPDPLSSDYSFNQIPLTGFSDYRVIITLIIYIALIIIALAGLLWALKSKKNPEFKRNMNLISFGILFFLITFSLYTNIIVLIGTSMGERLLFVPILGFSLILAYAVSKIFKVDIYETVTTKNIGGFIKKFRGIFVVLLIIMVAYGFKTVSRNAEWKDNYTLYSSDVKKSPNSSRIHYHYGLTIVQDKALKESNNKKKVEYLDSAIVQFNKAIEIYKFNSDIYDQLALAYMRKGDNESALKYFEKTIELDSLKARPYSNMGMIYFNSGKVEKARGLYEKAVELDPRFADAWYNLGSTYGTLGLIDDAIRSFLQCLKFDPEKPEAHYFLGFTYMNKGDNTNALSSFNNCIKYRPSYAEAYLYKAHIYEKTGNIQEAQKNYNQAYKLKPSLKK